MKCGARFCFKNDFSEIDIWRSFMVENLPGVVLPKLMDFSMDFPSTVLHLKMNNMQTAKGIGAFFECR